MRVKEELVCGDRAESLLVQGDAGAAMSALLAGNSERNVAGTIKLCYLDPPYNTGERFEHYNDRADRAEWLTTMRDHLRAARQMLAPDGSSGSTSMTQSSIEQGVCSTRSSERSPS